MVKSLLIQKSLLISVLLFLNGCTLYRHSLDPELHKIREQAHAAMEQELDWETKKFINEDEAQKGVSLKVALWNSILVDPSLRALLEEVGVALADFVQAGYPTNPNIAAAFQFPTVTRHQCDAGFSYLDLIGTFTISDFWQIPYKKKVAHDEFEIKSVEALNKIVEITTTAEITYYAYLYQRTQLAIVEGILNHLRNLVANAEDNYKAGYINQYDRLFADTIIAQWEIKKLEHEKLWYDALIDFRNTIGLELISVDVPLITDWDPLLVSIPDPVGLFTYAENTNLDLQILSLKVAQARHQISLDRSKIIDNVTMGLEYTRDTAELNYVGPVIAFDMPVFDFQQAQIERARRVEKREKQNLENTLYTISGEIFKSCKKIQIAQDTIKVYKENVVPASEKALIYASKKNKNLPIDFAVLITTQIDLLMQPYNLNTHYFNLAKEISNLEKLLCSTIPYGLPTEKADIIEFIRLRRKIIRDTTI